MNRRNQPALFSIILTLLPCLPLLAGESLSLPDATARALEKHPSLAVFDAEMRLAEAKVISALMRPNPELDAEAEDILGSGEYRDFDSAIYTVGISQLLELGGKRKLRGTVAEAEAEAEKLRYEVLRREVILETARRYVAVLAAQAAVANAEETVKIDEQTVGSVEALQEGGRGSALDVGRSELGLKEAKLELENRKRETAIARQRLAAMWAEQKPSFQRVEGRLAAPARGVPSSDSLNAELETHPAVDLAKAGIASAESELQLERRQVTPDLTVGLGYRRDAVVEDNAVVLNFSLPLPFWNRNEGGIAEAEARVARSEGLTGQATAQLEMAAAETLARLAAAKAEYDLVSGELLPAAEKHHDTLTEGYGLGRTSFLELLEGRRALVAYRKARIEALARYHTARVELEALTGKSH